jgi:hypothetical protein
VAKFVNTSIIVAITCADVPDKCNKTHEECKDTDAGPVCHCESGYYKAKDRVTRTPLKTGGELRWALRLYHP